MILLIFNFIIFYYFLVDHFYNRIAGVETNI